MAQGAHGCGSWLEGCFLCTLLERIGICFTYCNKEESKLFMTNNILEHVHTAIGILFGVENDLLKQSLRGETLNNNILLAMPKFPNQLDGLDFLQWV